MNKPKMNLTYEQKENLISLVREAVSEDPELFTRVVFALHSGLKDARDEAYERAADFETATVWLLESRNKGIRKNQISNFLSLVESKISNWRNRTSVNWSAYVKYFPNLKEDAKVEKDAKVEGTMNSIQELQRHVLEDYPDDESTGRVDVG